MKRSPVDRSTRLIEAMWRAALLSIGLMIPSVSSAATRSALIVQERSPVVQLTETLLLELPDAEWLERSEIDRVLAEQKLQTLFAPESTASRSALGKILKADLLVFIQAAETQVDGQPRKSAELAVAQTATGLRLVSRSVPLTDDAQADAQALVALVNQGFVKNTQEIQRVYAVPPFVSQDLTYENDHLKQAFARLIEQALLDQPGTLVVELAEADSIAREAALTGADAKLGRILPFYLLGEYRHEGVGEDQQLTISLSINRGAEQLQSERKTLAPDAAPAFLLATVGQFGKLSGAELRVVDPATEAKQLADRAEVFRKLGNDEESLSLLEASLLLDPQQVTVRREAMITANNLVEKWVVQHFEAMVRTIHTRLRRVEHFRRLVADFQIEEIGEPKKFLGRLSSRSDSIFSYQVPENLLRDFREYRSGLSETALQLAHKFAQAGDWENSAFCLHCATIDLDPVQRYELQTKLIHQYQDELPTTVKMAKLFSLRQGYLVSPSVERLEYLQRLAQSPQSNQHVRAAAHVMIADLEKQRLKLSTPAPFQQREIASGSAMLGFKPAQIAYRNSMGKHILLRELAGCLPLTDGTDVVWDRRRVFAVKQKGIAQQVWGPRHKWDEISSLTYDGQYIWMTVNSQEEAPQVWVLNPLNWKRAHVGKEQGLPVFSRHELPEKGNMMFLTGTAISPGEAIVIGSTNRVWLAHLKVNSEGRPEVNVFHEAKEIVAPDTPDVWKNIHAVFHPTSFQLLSQDGKDGAKDRKVFIGRDRTAGMFGHPLVVDLNDLSVSALEGEWELSTEGLTGMPREGIYEGRLYYFQPDPPDYRSLSLVSRGLAELRPKQEIPNIKEGYVFVADGVINVVGKEWHRGELSKHRLTAMGLVPWRFDNRFAASGSADVPPLARGDLVLHAIMASNHYGTLVCCEKQLGDSALAQVVFDGSGGTIEEAFKASDQTAPSIVVNTGTARPEANEVVLWETTGRRIRDIACIPDGKRIVTAIEDETNGLAIWDAKTGNLLSELNTGTAMDSLCISKSGKYFAAAASDEGKIILGTTEPFAQVHLLQGHKNEVRSLAFSWDDKLLASTSSDRLGILWDVDTGKSVRHLKGRTTWLNWLAFTPDNARVIGIGFFDRGSGVWDARTGDLVDGIETLQGAVGFSPGGAIVGTTSWGVNNLFGWDLENAQHRIVWPKFQGHPVALSEDGRRIAAYERNGFVEGVAKEIHLIKVYDLATKTALAESSGGYFSACAFSPDEKVLFVVRRPGIVERLHVGSPAALGAN